MFEPFLLSHILILSAFAMCTSALTSLVGAGGGTALLALMLYFIPAASVIPVHGCIQLISNTTRVYLFWKYMNWGIIIRFAALMPLGVYLGLLFHNSLTPEYIQLIIASAILLSLFIVPTKSSNTKKLPKAIFYILGLFTGFGNIMVGVLAPVLASVLRFENLSKDETVGTLGFFGFFGNLLKIAGFTVIGFSFVSYLPLLIPACIASILGSVLGKALLKRSSNKFFRYAFQTMIFLLSANLILDVFI